MRNRSVRLCLTLIAFLAAVPDSLSAQTQTAPASAPEPGSCSIGTASADLGINNVLARSYAFGTIAYGNGEEARYVVPVSEGASPIYSTGIMIGGLVGGELRTAAAQYHNFEYWPGPLGSEGRPVDASDCSAYDRIWKVDVVDIAHYETTGAASQDLAAWPAHLGAPVVAAPRNGFDDDGDGLVDEGTDGVDSDGDGFIDEADELELRTDGGYDLEAGDRPYLIGDQALWWIMNDVGNVHEFSETPPIGIEVRVHAFAFYGKGALGNTTFYRYEITHHGDAPLEDAYFTIFSDPDLGDASDDYVGVDTTLGLGYVYNSDAIDRVYGTAPAAGYDFFSGPTTRDRVRLGATSMLFAIGGGPLGTEEPRNGEEIYNVQRGLWRDGTPLTVGSYGRGSGNDTTTFAFPGDPTTGAFWSEVNADGEGNALQPGDRRLYLSTGPFDVEPGATQEILYGILWARGTDHLDSVRELRDASESLQAFVDAGFAPREFADPPAAAPRLVTPGDGASRQPVELTLRWTETEDATWYRVQIGRDEAFLNVVEDISTHDTELTTTLAPNTTYFWRVRSVNAGGPGPHSDVASFTTSGERLDAAGPLLLSDGGYGFVEISGAGGADPCGPGAESRDGCEEVGGNAVYESYNGTLDYYAHRASATPGPEESIGAFALNTFEIRFTDQSSLAVHALTSGNVMEVPLEIWDIGPVGPGQKNDPADDVRLVPVLFSDGSGECEFGYGEVQDDPFGEGWPGTDRIYAYYPQTSYADWAEYAAGVLEGDADRCHLGGAAADYVDFDAGRPIQRLVFYGNPDGPNYRPEGPPPGTVIRFYTRAGSAPVPSAPADGAAGLSQPTSLWWNAHASARSYHLQVDDDAAFGSPEIDADTLDRPTFTVSGLPTNTYYWRVRIGTSVGTWGSWSETWSFTAATDVAVEVEAALPEAVTLASNFPNPFNPTTTLRFALPRAADVRLEVYDVLGRRIATLAYRPMGAGWHTLVWDAKGVSSGTYFVRLSAGGETDVRKVVLLR